MDNQTKNILIIGAIALGGYMYLNPAKKETYYIVNGQSVPESQLASMGYVLLNGKWWPPNAVAQAASQGGVGIPNTTPGTNQSTDQTWAIISTLLSTGMQFIPLFTGDGNATGGTSGSGSNMDMS